MLLLGLRRVCPKLYQLLLSFGFHDDAIYRLYLNVNDCQEATTSHTWYSMGSPKTTVRLEGGLKVLALPDPGAEINVIMREVMEDVGLAIRHGSRLELVSHTGHSRPFFGLYEDIEVVVGGLKTRHPIFVVEHGDPQSCVRTSISQRCQV